MRVIICPGCNGNSVSRSDVGRVEYGGCEVCDGTELVTNELVLETTMHRYLWHDINE
jgi:Zn-finger nucleic acid-binding protein